MGGPPQMGGGGGGGATEWDPDNVLGPAGQGHIQRNLMKKQIEKDSEFAAAVSATKDDIRRQVLLRRSQRSPPDDPAELVEYFLNSDAEDMEYEVARCRPKLTPEFFKALDGMIGAERFDAPKTGLVSAAAAAREDADAAAAKSEERLAELELLRRYLEEAAEAVDKAVASTSTAVERMKKLLGAKDKKAMIIEMTEANEIDVPLMDLLQQNIDGARMAGQEEAAAFMEKVKAAAAKYLISSLPAAGVAAMPTAPLGLTGGGGDAATSSSGLILPGSAGRAPPPPPPPQQQQPEQKSLIL
ncbi:MAG: hypothetical protein J3K34DRAFT_401973 [Monoraphidium minutum]|nr:MAG: hypothetical protein J3K34DRAFT_401973 [Monoraphidium minutum]